MGELVERTEEQRGRTRWWKSGRGEERGRTEDVRAEDTAAPKPLMCHI